MSSSGGDTINNSTGTKSRSNSKPHIEPPAARRSSFDAVVHNLASRVLAPLFPDSAGGSSSSSSGSAASGAYKLDAGVTPKRRSTFSIFQTVKAKGMHGENYKTSMKLAPLEQVPSSPTTAAAVSATVTPVSEKTKTLTSSVLTSPPRIFGSSSTIGNSRSGSEATMDNNLPGVSPGSAKGSPITPVTSRKSISKKKLSHHHIKNYL